MRERREIVQLWQKGQASVLVTLVHVQGSSYRKPGARLLLCEGGGYAGTISGGCLESEVHRRAGWLSRNGAIVERYSTLFDESADVPYGLGCGGVVDLLLEPAKTAECEALLVALEETLRGSKRIVVTTLPRANHRLARAVFDAAGDVLFASEAMPDATVSYARSCIAQGLLPEENDFFVETLSAPSRLFVLGAGDDAKPLVNMASQMGWHVIVVDGRSQLARAERFPAAHRVVQMADDFSVAEVRREDAVVVMTHSYEQDRELLTSMLPVRPRYLGLLGARHRSSLLISEAATRLGLEIEDCCRLVTAPVGLDLGGEGPDAIALSVIAEVQACFMGRSNRTRRLTADDVSKHLMEGGASRYLQTQCAMDAV